MMLCGDYTISEFIQEHMDDLIEILNIMEGSYTHPDISNRIDRLRNEAENGG